MDIPSLGPVRARAVAAMFFLLAVRGAGAVPGHRVHFDKIVLCPVSRAGGGAVADVNQDGRRDVLAGEVWYEAPAWTRHEIRSPGSYDAATGYSNCFLSWARGLH